MSYIKEIEQASHIVLVATSKADSLCSASVFYTYLMRLHKKVTLYIDEKELPENLSFIPWFDKIKPNFPTSADFIVCFGIQNKPIEIMACSKVLNIDNNPANSHYGAFNVVDLNSISITQVVFDFFRTQEIRINAKMATSLYGGLIDGSFNFTKINGTSFAFASLLIQNGAEYQKCIAFIAQFRTLGMLRLKATMFSKMQLKVDGSVACFEIEENDFKSSGTQEVDAIDIVREALYLPTVSYALIVFVQDDKNIKVTLLKRSVIEIIVVKEIVEECKELDTILENIRLDLKDKI